ncbi:MAG: hypothetical protein ACN6O8_09920 [Achromobacter sp.]|uniref:hypothetical protein n=1 Tax=Achromobacter sp. TaxID=134375 RepID=UPI003D05BFA9
MFNPLNAEARWRASSVLLALLAAAACKAEPAIQAVAPTPPPAPVSRLVGDILELDARRALLIEQRENTPAAPLGAIPFAAGQPTAATSDPPAAQAAGQPVMQLQVIVGVGRNLSAVVVRANQRWVFQSGRPSPVAGPDTYLRLIRIETPCAVFRKMPQASARQPLAAEPGTAVEPAEQLTLCLQHVPP